MHHPYSSHPPPPPQTHQPQYHHQQQQQIYYVSLPQQHPSYSYGPPPSSQDQFHSPYAVGVPHYDYGQQVTFVPQQRMAVPAFPPHPSPYQPQPQRHYQQYSGAASGPQPSQPQGSSNLSVANFYRPPTPAQTHQPAQHYQHLPQPVSYGGGYRPIASDSTQAQAQAQAEKKQSEVNAKNRSSADQHEGVVPEIVQPQPGGSNVAVYRSVMTLPPLYGPAPYIHTQFPLVQAGQAMPPEPNLMKRKLEEEQEGTLVPRGDFKSSTKKQRTRAINSSEGPFLAAATAAHDGAIGGFESGNGTPKSSDKKNKKRKKKKLIQPTAHPETAELDRQPSPSAAAAAAVLLSAFDPAANRPPTPFVCDTCGKAYKNSSCLAKHVWEHSEYWDASAGIPTGAEEQSRASMTKHQQAVLLQAASILVGFGSADGATAGEEEDDGEHAPESPGDEVWTAVLRTAEDLKKRRRPSVGGWSSGDEGSGESDWEGGKDDGDDDEDNNLQDAGSIVTPPLSSPSQSPSAAAAPLPFDGLAVLSAAAAMRTMADAPARLTKGRTHRKRRRPDPDAKAAPLSPVTAALTAALRSTERAGSAVADGTLRELVKARREARCAQTSNGGRVVGGGGAGGIAGLGMASIKS